MYDWLEQTDREMKGKCGPLNKAVLTWKQYRDIENAKHDHGGAHVPAARRDRMAEVDDPEYSSDDEFDEEEEGVLYVTIVKAENLPRLDMMGYDRLTSPSLYVTLGCEGQKEQTPTADDTYTPQWNAKFRLRVSNPESVLMLDMYNSNLMKDHLHWATLKVPLLELEEGTTWNWYRLTDFVDESRSEARLNVLTDEERTEEECPKGAIQIRFQYAPPEISLDAATDGGGIRLNARRGAIVDIEKFVGAYAADFLDVEARITQGLLWSTRYVVISSIWKGSPETEKFVLLTYKDKQSWDDGAEALAQLRLGESEIGLDPRAESRGAGFFVKNRKGSAHFRAASQDDAADWMTALRSLQYAEMVQWGSSHVCRWLEAQGVDDTVLHNVHHSGLTGHFFARAVAADEYEARAVQLRDKASLTLKDATATLEKVKAAQLGSEDVRLWLEEADRDIHGKSKAVKQAAALLHSPAAHLEEMDSTAVAAAEPARRRSTSPQRGRRASADAERVARQQKIKQDLAKIKQELSRQPGNASMSSPSQRFDPEKWKEQEDRKLLLVQQKKLRKEQEELERRQEQTTRHSLAAKYPRGAAVYARGARGANPDFSHVESKYKKEAAGYRDKRERAEDRDSRTHLSHYGPSLRSSSATERKLPTDSEDRARFRDPKVVPPHASGNELATKLESLIDVHRNLQEHQELVDVVVHRLREEETKMRRLEHDRQKKRKQDKQAEKLRTEHKKMKEQCMMYEKTVKALQEASESALEKYSVSRKHAKDASKKEKDARELLDEKASHLEIEREHTRVLKDKLRYSKDLLSSAQMDSARAQHPTGAITADDLKEKEDEIAKLKDQVERERRKAVVAKHEATERGKVLVGAAQKLEKEQEDFQKMKTKLQKREAGARAEGIREGKSDADREINDLKQQIHSATEMVFQLSECLGLADGHRFKFADDGGWQELIEQVKKAVVGRSKQVTTVKRKEKRVQELQSEVKELRDALRKEQADAYRMLAREGAKESTGGGGGSKSSEVKRLQAEKSRLEGQISVHNTQMEAERHRTRTEKDKVQRLEQELRRLKLELRTKQVRPARPRHAFCSRRLRLTRAAVLFLTRRRRRMRRSGRISRSGRASPIRCSRRLGCGSRCRRPASRPCRPARRSTSTTTRLCGPTRAGTSPPHSSGSRLLSCALTRFASATTGCSSRPTASNCSTARRGRTATRRRRSSPSTTSATSTSASSPVPTKPCTEQKQWPCSEHRGAYAENMERHSAVIDTPAWYCFSIALRTKTVDFSARSEEEAALWVCGLRTLLEYKRGDSRGQEVGRFFWNRASMRTKRLADEAGMDHMKFISERVWIAAREWEETPHASTRGRSTCVACPPPLLAFGLGGADGPSLLAGTTAASQAAAVRAACWALRAGRT